MREWAARCERLIVLSESQVARAEQPARRHAGALRRGVRTASTPTFTRRPSSALALWRKYLVESPQGWAPGAEAGSVRYTDADLAPFAGDGPVLLYVGRFTAVKRLRC
jgi:hypothetical protein